MIYEIKGISFDLPEWAKARLSEESSDIVMFLDQAETMHVACRLEDAADNLTPALCNLGGMIFEKEHPGQYGECIRQWVAAKQYNGEMFPPWKQMHARLMELQA